MTTKGMLSMADENLTQKQIDYELATARHEATLTRETLVRTTDKLGSLIATIHTDGGDDAEGTMIGMALDAFAELWKLRWELNVSSGEVRPAGEEAS